MHHVPAQVRIVLIVSVLTETINILFICQISVLHWLHYNSIISVMNRLVNSNLGFSHFWYNK